MAKYKSCKNCPAYNHRYLSKEDGICALGYKFSDENDSIKPLEDCIKPKNITELHITAKKLGISLPGGDNLMDEKNYTVYQECLILRRALIHKDDKQVLECLIKLKSMATEN